MIYCECCGRARHVHPWAGCTEWVGPLRPACEHAWVVVPMMPIPVCRACGKIDPGEHGLRRAP